MFYDGRPLDRPFNLIAFDWDGTAVTSRAEDATPLREATGKLLSLGVYIVVITGTNFQNIDRQLSSASVGPRRDGLYICTNRGSEVYGFDANLRPKLIWRRTATPEEDRLLTEVAVGIRSYLERSAGPGICAIYTRLNRRKIDLIPLPEWADPPKSAIGDLLQAVEQRLRAAGIRGGIHEVFAVAERLALEAGLPQARVTTDVKHIEVGLTDKRDSIEWMMRELADKAGIPTNGILIGGDEFGPVAGFEGSDDRMVTPAARVAVFVSVGIEPNGVPPGVIHLGGGPARFRKLLEEQIHLHESRHGRIEQPLPGEDVNPRH